MAAFFAAHPDLLEAQVAHRLRSARQFKGESLAAHLAFAQQRAVVDNARRVVQLKPDEQAGWRLRAKLREADRDPRVAFACVQSLERATPAWRAELAGWLDRRIGTLRDAADAAVSCAR